MSSSVELDAAEVTPAPHRSPDTAEAPSYTSTPSPEPISDEPDLCCYCGEGALQCIKYQFRAEPHPWAILLLISAGSFLTGMQSSTLIIAFPDIVEHAGSPIVAVFWMLLGYLLSVTALVTVAGKMGDLFGKSTVIKIGLFIFGLASLLCGLAARKSWKGWDIVSYRVLTGLGGAMILGNSASVVTDAFMGPRLGLAMGTMGLAAGLGFALGPLIGGALIRVSWRWVFLINVPIAWVVLVLSLMFLRDPALTRKKVAKTNAERKAILRRFDWVGFALLTFFLVTFLTALSEQAFATMSNVTIGCLWGMGVLGLIGFIAVELYVDNPILKLSLFKIPTFTLMNITNFLVMISAGQILYAMLFYFQGPYKQDPFKAGVSTLPFGLAMAVAGLASGLLADVIGLKFLSLIGIILCTGGSIGFIWLQATTGFGLICFLLIVVGAGIGLFNSPTNKGIMASVEPAQRGAASSTPVLLLNLSRMISLVILFSGSFSALSTDTLLAIFLQGGGAGIDETTLHTFMNGVYICTWIAIGCWLAALILTFFLKEDFWSTWHNFKNAKSKAKLTSDSDNAVTPVGCEESPK